MIGLIIQPRGPLTGVISNHTHRLQTLWQAVGQVAIWCVVREEGRDLLPDKGTSQVPSVRGCVWVCGCVRIQFSIPQVLKLPDSISQNVFHTPLPGSSPAATHTHTHESCDFTLGSHDFGP